MACTCPSALQSVTSAFYSQAASAQTAAYWGRTPTTPSTQNKAVHTNHSATEVADFMMGFILYINGDLTAKQDELGAQCVKLMV